MKNQTKELEENKNFFIQENDFKENKILELEKELDVCKSQMEQIERSLQKKTKEYNQISLENHRLSKETEIFEKSREQIENYVSKVSQNVSKLSFSKENTFISSESLFKLWTQIENAGNQIFQLLNTQAPILDSPEEQNSNNNSFSQIQTSQLVEQLDHSFNEQSFPCIQTDFSFGEILDSSSVPNLNIGNNSPSSLSPTNKSFQENLENSLKKSKEEIALLFEKYTKVLEEQLRKSFHNLQNYFRISNFFQKMKVKSDLLHKKFEHSKQQIELLLNKNKEYQLSYSNLEIECNDKENEICDQKKRIETLANLNIALEERNERLIKECSKLSGHQNTKQKIQHFKQVKIEKSNLQKKVDFYCQQEAKLQKSILSFFSLINEIQKLSKEKFIPNLPSFNETSEMEEIKNVFLKIEQYIPKYIDLLSNLSNTSTKKIQPSIEKKEKKELSSHENNKENNLNLHSIKNKKPSDSNPKSQKPQNPQNREILFK